MTTKFTAGGDDHSAAATASAADPAAGSQAPVATNPAAATSSAGAFDIRNVIGALLGIYGIVLVLCTWLLDPGINPDTGMAKDPVYNLYTGIALIVSAAIFMVWAKISPIVVDEHA